MENLPYCAAPASLYSELLAAGVEMGNHYSDLYVKASPASLGIILRHRAPVNPFRSNIDGSMWYDVPFAYDPYWAVRLQRPSVV